MKKQSVVGMKLNRGDSIGVVSPSAPVPVHDVHLANGIRYLESMGFRVVVGKYVHSNTLGYSANPLEKAQDINDMFADRSIKAVICSQGGDTANTCLRYLDWNIIGDNPKVFSGMSDITVLLNAIHAKTGLITFHGNDVRWGFGENPHPYAVQEFVHRLVDSRIGKIPAAGQRRTIRRGVAEGKLLGGNLRCLLKLAGTPYCPDFAESILFVEALDITPEACDSSFSQLEQMGAFDKPAGVIIGYIDGLQRKAIGSIQMEEILLRVTSDYDFPILKVNDFGHNCPNTTLPVGAQARVDADKQEIEILQDCVATP